MESGPSPGMGFSIYCSHALSFGFGFYFGLCASYCDVDSLFAEEFGFGFDGVSQFEFGGDDVAGVVVGAERGLWVVGW